MAALQESGAFDFSGVGGELMQAQGMHSLFPMRELSMMGLAEILPHIPKLLERIDQVVDDILAKRPRIVITIDSPGFTFRVVKKLREKGYKDSKFVHYVAPTVWAYKPERAKKTADLFDALMVILPFEPPYFEKEGLKTHYVGHPVAWEYRTRPDAISARLRLGIKDSEKPLLMMPGSRMGELKRHLPIFKDAIHRMVMDVPNLCLIIPQTSDTMHYVKHEVAGWMVPAYFVQGTQGKQDAMAASVVGLVKSGTASLEGALAQLPYITAHKVNGITAFIARRVLKIPYVNLVNILLHKPIVPEFLQDQCFGPLLGGTLAALMDAPNVRGRQIDAFKEVGKMLGNEEETSPSHKAAKVILDIVSF